MATRELEGLEVRRVPWSGRSGFRAWFGRNFQAGEHVFVVGTTGSGKSVLIREIVQLKPSWDVIVLDAKGGKDPSLQIPGFRTGYDWPPSEEHVLPAMLSIPEQMRRWFTNLVYGDRPEAPAEREPKRIHFAPPKLADDDQLRSIFDRVLRDLYLRDEGKGFEMIVFDEGNTLAGMPNDGGLGLYRRISPLFRVKRFERSSLVIGTQYPAWIPPSTYGETRHRFFFPVEDERRYDRIAEIAGDRRAPVTIKGLGDFEFLYQNTRRRLFFVSKVDS